MSNPYESAADWAAAIDELWHDRDGDHRLAHACAMGLVAGVALCQENTKISEDDNTVLISADGAWTVLLDPASNRCRAVIQTQTPIRSIRIPDTELQSRPTTARPGRRYASKQRL